MGHNVLSEWLYESLCTMFTSTNGNATCVSFVGPLQEHQSLAPIELHWPEDQPTVIKKLEQVQNVLLVGAMGSENDHDSNNLSAQQLSETKAHSMQPEVGKRLLDQMEANMESKLDIHSTEIKAAMEEMKAEMAKFLEQNKQVEEMKAEMEEMETEMKAQTKVLEQNKQETEQIKDMVNQVLEALEMSAARAENKESVVSFD